METITERRARMVEALNAAADRWLEILASATPAPRWLDADHRPRRSPARPRLLPRANAGRSTPRRAHGRTPRRAARRASGGATAGSDGPAAPSSSRLLLLVAPRGHA